MLDTKLKNRHKLAVVLILMVVMIPALIMINEYGDFYYESTTDEDEMERQYLCSDDFLGLFMKSNYVLYDMEQKGKNSEVREEYPELWDSFNAVYPYMDYQISDGTEILDKSLSGSGEKLTETNLSAYTLGIMISYDKDGIATVEKVTGENADDQYVALKSILNTGISDYEEELAGLAGPVSRTYMYGISEEHLEDILKETYFYPYDDYIPESIVYGLIVLVLIICGAAWLLPRWKSLHTGDEKIFYAPLEVPVLVFIVALPAVIHYMDFRRVSENGAPGILDFSIWTLLFAVVYWGAGCIRRIWVVGIREYIKKYTLTYRFCVWIKKNWHRIVSWVKEQINKLYRSLDDIDFSDKNNKVIFKIVLVNFLILLVICCFWFFGVVGLVIYSVILFVLLRKYFNDLKDKYALLLKATNEIAEGNLDVEISGDLGVFSPFRTEIEKIQRGFKKAVDEEVKSQKMKTELITNVSHDLKTPLTAIITYVNLLKDEKDDEKRRDYVEVLERKSLRLKVLIEDLFEISKASSENVTLELMNIDIVNLFKQVKLELDDKIKAAGLDFKMNLPEEKMILNLDSQKTYRIFENLLVNITKYALPHTRVYIDMCREGEEAVIRMKNISAAELNFNPEEITERFVRGDVSRNTEGSGLGLAIAKSFVELQKGTMKIETEADLFKAEIRWKM